jgi:hypothetical protein
LNLYLIRFKAWGKTAGVVAAVSALLSMATGIFWFSNVAAENQSRVDALESKVWDLLDQVNDAEQRILTCEHNTKRIGQWLNYYREKEIE